MSREELQHEIGEKARAWKGDKAGYHAKHLWIVKHYGNASKCEMCDTKSSKRFEWANISGKYLRSRDDYRQLCPSCHRRLDYGNVCKRGHEFTEENTYISKSGWRICRKCRVINNKTYYNKKAKNARN